MDINKEREAFEAWYCESHTGLKQSDLAKFRTPSGYFFSDPLKIDVSWEAWQAAKAKAVLEGFAVVPIEITPKQIEAYMKGKVFPASMGEHRKFVERLSKDYTAMIEAAQEPAND
ncbi:hypothetical protein [Acinetobacter sp. UBA801]|uniref:hypothetical protein n=1 Tax=Acinetobacter sp. UBA801 TaxID=1945958 RepID=UPI0025BA606F|nr:hypothetical protein [Acinetobacter sp. UBA801]